MTSRLTTIAGIVALLIATGTFASGREMSVEVGSGDIRSQPSGFSSVVASVKYGDRLTVVEEKGGWTKVTTADQKTTGWIATSSLTKKRIVLAAAGKDAGTGASSGEVALAGKGFTEEVEKQYKAKHANIDFSMIDKMVKSKISNSELLTFLKDGGLKIPEGGAK